MSNLINCNTMLSSLKNSEIRELLELVKNFNYEYLDSVNLPNNLHFGIEIEFERGMQNAIKTYMINEYNAVETKKSDYKKWNISNDASLYNGMELSSPILTDEKNTWIEIKDICEMLNRSKAVATHRTGAHVHFNFSYLKDNYKNLIRLIELYTVYENILIKFGYGHTGKPRQNLFTYAKPIGQEIKSKLLCIMESKNWNDLCIWMPYHKHSSINFKNINWENIENDNKNTIEFRSANGTVDYSIWQNLVNTYGHLIKSCTNLTFDDEFIKYKIKTFYYKNCHDEQFYNKVYLREALELVDTIFDNDYDKLMFLKNYINNNEIDELMKKINQKTICIK